MTATKSASAEDIARALAEAYIRAESQGERERLQNLACLIGEQVSHDVNLFLWRIIEIALWLDRDKIAEGASGHDNE